MTNGEKIQTILNVDRDCTEVHGENGTMTFTVTQEFWNAEYKEPIAKNDLVVDYISRESVLKLIYDYKENHSSDREHYPINYGTLFDMIRWVYNLPSVTPQEPRAGHWIEHPHEWGDNWQYSDYECSICHNWAHFDTDFCPNCGAKMVESEE